MVEERIIKKYPNRRLYDTELSKYVALVDLRKLIHDGVDLKVAYEGELLVAIDVEGDDGVGAGSVQHSAELETVDGDGGGLLTLSVDDRGHLVLGAQAA